MPITFNLPYYSGKVVDIVTLLPLPGATVSIQYKGAPTQTQAADNQGRFLFWSQKLAEKITITHVGHKPLEILYPKKRDDIYKLEQDIKIIDPVIVKAKKKKPPPPPPPPEPEPKKNNWFMWAALLSLFFILNRK
jgi:hypothetical protein